MKIGDVASALYRGTLTHVRRAVRPHAFSYRTYQVLLNLDELPQLAASLWPLGYNRRALTTFYDRDHLHPGPRPVHEKLQRLFHRAGLAHPGGPTLLLTNLRVLGYVFNPVSFYYCLDADRTLRLVVAEVNNTFGERHCYLLTDLRLAAGGVQAVAAKVFHVSPFFPIAGEYRFTFTPPAQRLHVHIQLRREGQLDFWAEFAAQRQPLTSRTLLAALIGVPLVTLRTIIAIHWQALLLWRKGVPFYRKPAPPPSLLEEAQ